MSPCDILKPLKLITLQLHPFSTRFNGYIKCILLISNTDELREQCGAQIAKIFHPIIFSNILGFPNCCNDLGDAYKWISKFYGDYGDSAIWHVKYFLQLITDFNILYEDHMMEMFASTFRGEAGYWFYQGLPDKCVTSFQDSFGFF